MIAAESKSRNFENETLCEITRLQIRKIRTLAAKPHLTIDSRIDEAAEARSLIAWFCKPESPPKPDRHFAGTTPFNSLEHALNCLQNIDTAAALGALAPEIERLRKLLASEKRIGYGRKSSCE